MLRNISVSGFLFTLLSLPFICSGLDFFERYTDLDEKTMERRFFESMDHYLPPDPQRGNEIYIRAFDPSQFEEWIVWVMEESEIPGIALCLMKEGNLFWKTNLGYANLEQGIQVNDSTVTCLSMFKILIFRIAPSQSVI
jgi:hypothetical protein